MADRTHLGLLSGELLHLAITFYPLIGRTICKSRNLTPRPASVISFQSETAQEHPEAKVKQWMTNHLRYCDEANATPVPTVHEALKRDLGDIEPTLRTAAGLGPKRHQFRRGAKQNWFYFYKVSLKEGEVPLPVQLIGL